jgi:hypothetical protein
MGETSLILAGETRFYELSRPMFAFGYDNGKYTGIERLVKSLAWYSTSGSRIAYRCGFNGYS